MQKHPAVQMMRTTRISSRSLPLRTWTMSCLSLQTRTWVPKLLVYFRACRCHAVSEMGSEPCKPSLSLTYFAQSDSLADGFGKEQGRLRGESGGRFNIDSQQGEALSLAGTAEDAHTAAGACDLAMIAAPADACQEKKSPASPEHPQTDVQSPSASAPEAAPQAESEDAMEEDPLSEKPQEAAPAVTDTLMQDADRVLEGSAEEPADAGMASQDAHMSTAEEPPAPDQAAHHPPGDLPAPGAAQASHEPASTCTAPLPAQRGGASGAGLASGTAGKLPAEAGPAAVLDIHCGVLQTAQVRSASAGSAPNSSAGPHSVAAADQKAAQMYSPAAGILTKASAGGRTAAADPQPQTGPMLEAAAVAASKALAVQMQASQICSATPGVSPGVSKAVTGAALVAAAPAMIPGFSNHQQQQLQKPGAEAPHDFHQTQRAADTPEAPATAADAHRTAAPAGSAARAGQPGPIWPQLGSSAITPPLPALPLFPSPAAASSIKA